MTIRIVTPAGTKDRNGNSITALRWARILKGLGHRVFVARDYRGEACELLVALHARKPLVVALTGTDLYRDIRSSAPARGSLDLATRLVVLQSMGVKELAPRLRRKTRVIYQSAPRVKPRPPRGNGFVVAVIGHLRPVKDPLRTAYAARQLNGANIRVVQAGRALGSREARRARAEMERNPRYRWIGEVPHWKARQLLAASDLLSLTSVMEGSANVLSEAIASSVPVVASKISGLIGTLGSRYPGYFRVGDTRGLAR